MKYVGILGILRYYEDDRSLTLNEVLIANSAVLKLDRLFEDLVKEKALTTIIYTP